MGNKSTTSKTISYGLKFQNSFDDDLSLPVESVIVTTFSGSSYDDLFRSVPQKAPEGRVALYVLEPEFTEILFDVFKGKSSLSDFSNDCKTAVEQLMTDIKKVDPDCVLFNWECCSGLNQDGNHFYSPVVVQFISYLISKGYYLMFSDFAVKAIINDWKEKLLGPKVFSEVGTTSGSMTLSFDSNALKECPSNQLQMVGNLSQDGTCVVDAMAGTVVFSADEKKSNNGMYDLSILTVVTQPINIKGKKTYGQFSGTIGHAMLKYKSGSVMTLSAGHWVELLGLKVSVETLEKVAVEKYGDKYSEQINSMKAIESEGEQQEKVSEMAKNFVKQNVNCKYQSSKMKSSSK